MAWHKIGTAHLVGFLFLSQLFLLSFLLLMGEQSSLSKSTILRKVQQCPAISQMLAATHTKGLFLLRNGNSWGKVWEQ